MSGLTTPHPGEPGVAVRRLGPDEWEGYRLLRLEMLLDTPEAFAATHAPALALTERRWRKRLASGTTLWAEVGGRPAGTVTLWVAPDSPRQTVNLVAMYVAPWCRGRRIGAALVDAALDEARREGHRVVELEVTATNAPAIALYRGRGFVPTGASRPHPVLDGYEELAMHTVLA